MDFVSDLLTETSCHGNFPSAESYPYTRGGGATMHPWTTLSRFAAGLSGAVFTQLLRKYTMPPSVLIKQISSTCLGTGVGFLNCKHFDTWFKTKREVLFCWILTMSLMMEQDNKDADCESEYKWIKKPGLNRPKATLINHGAAWRVCLWRNNQKPKHNRRKCFVVLRFRLEDELGQL